MTKWLVNEETFPKLDIKVSVFYNREGYFDGDEIETIIEYNDQKKVKLWWHGDQLEKIRRIINMMANATLNEMPLLVNSENELISILAKKRLAGECWK